MRTNIGTFFAVRNVAADMARYGLALEAGHCVLTGSFTRLTAIHQGDQWRTQFSSLGRVTATFV